ncbi:MAG: DNA-3-methyladenine glycosylase 2 family protein [Alphaproteobacteria bacterium]|nr:DNA-3-methyladenine glycosylase 2 family protein [Alphaproteobacteria bacterium]
MTATGDLRLELPVEVPLDIGRTMGPSMANPARRRRGTEAWWAHHTPEGPGTVRCRHVDDRLVVDAWGDGAGWLLARAGARLGLDDDDRDFQAHHPGVAALRRQTVGMRVGRTERVWDALLPTILGQRVTARGAMQSLAAIAKRWGEPAPGPGGLGLLPRPEVIAGLSYAHLHPCNVEAQRARAILRVARAAPRLEEIVGLSRADAYARLIAVPGIGPWTAPHVMSEACGDADAVPLGDYHLPSTVAWHIAGERIADDRRMVELLRPYRGHRHRVIKMMVGVRDRSPRRGPRQEIVDIRGW